MKLDMTKGVAFPFFERKERTLIDAHEGSLACIGRSIVCSFAANSMLAGGNLSAGILAAKVGSVAAAVNFGVSFLFTYLFPPLSEDVLAKNRANFLQVVVHVTTVYSLSNLISQYAFGVQLNAIRTLSLTVLGAVAYPIGQWITIPQLKG